MFIVFHIPSITDQSYEKVASPCLFLRRPFIVLCFFSSFTSTSKRIYDMYILYYTGAVYSVTKFRLQISIYVIYNQQF